MTLFAVPFLPHRLHVVTHAADDVVQEVLARLLAQLRGNVIIANPRAWAYRSIYRLAMDQHRMIATYESVRERT